MMRPDNLLWCKYLWMITGLAFMVLIAAGAWYGQRTVEISTALARGHYLFAANQLQRVRVQSDSSNSLVLTTLANLYYVGLGVAQNYRASAQLYSEAAFAGSIAAQVNLGNLYANGQGVEKDARLAYAWLNLARNNGSKIAQVYMSDLLADHQLSYHLVRKIRSDYVNLGNFPKLH